MSQPIGVCAVVLNNENQILMGVRKNSYKSGLYGLPGGRLELGETLEHAIKRELIEETGIVVEDVTYIGVVRDNQAEYDFIHFAFVCHLGDQQPQLMEPDKCEVWEWFDLDSLPSNILRGHLGVIELYKNQDMRLVDFSTDENTP